MAKGENFGNKYNAAILISSDRAAQGIRADATGPMLKEFLEEAGFTITSYVVLPDDMNQIVEILKKWALQDGINLILTSGGTGLGPRDVTPEATLKIIERRVPGMEEVMRRASAEITPYAILSRSVVGVAGDSLIINLPGSPKGALENLKILMPVIEHALDLITGKKADP